LKRRSAPQVRSADPRSKLARAHRAALRSRRAFSQEVKKVVENVLHKIQACVQLLLNELVNHEGRVQFVMCNTRSTDEHKTVVVGFEKGASLVGS
jgi:hypothetical protein